MYAQRLLDKSSAVTTSFKLFFIDHVGGFRQPVWTAMAMPKLPGANAGESLIPSPIMATVRPLRLQRLNLAGFFSEGNTLRYTIERYVDV
jgi:hypothetical protein